MKKLSFEQMEKVNGGGLSWRCGMALAAVGLSVAAFITMPAGALAAMIWGGSHLIASIGAVDACIDGAFHR